MFRKVLITSLFAVATISVATAEETNDEAAKQEHTTLSDSHRGALKQGRQEGATIRRYLEALRASIPARPPQPPQ